MKAQTTQTTLEMPKDGIAGLVQNWKSDMVSGFLVFLIALPLCLGIALASGFPPIGGIFTAIIGGLLVGPFCGSRMSIKGPAAGLIAIAIAAVEALGKGDNLLGYKLVLAVVVVTGLLQIVFGMLKAGSLNDFFPASAIHGMLAAIGIIIIAKQIPVMFGVKPDVKAPLELLAGIPRFISHLNPDIAIIGLVSLAILIILPMIKNRYVKMIPAPMLVLLVAIPLGRYFDLADEHTYLFNGNEYPLSPKFLVDIPFDIVKGISFPDFSQIFSLDSIQYIIMFALVGSIESLLTVKAVDGLDHYQRKSNANRDLLFVGVGNTLSGLVGGLPMISEVVRSRANVDNGAKTRWANVFHGGFLLLFVAFAPQLIHQIPLAALAAMLTFTGYRLASPRTFGDTAKIGMEQLIIFLVTIFFTLYIDLLVGIAAGIFTKLLIELFYGAPLSQLFKARVDVKEEKNNVLVTIYNVAVFTNYLGIKKYLYRIPEGKNVVIDLSQTHLVDHTVMEHLHHFEHDYRATGGTVSLRGLDIHQPNSAHPLAARRVPKNKRTTQVIR